jgi:hypothetical protein
MLHQLVATICGITMQTQVNACRITLQQATVEYNIMINQKVDVYRRYIENSDIVKSYRNEYTASIFYIGKVLYDKQISFTYGRQSFSARPGGINWTWRLTF